MNLDEMNFRHILSFENEPFRFLSNFYPVPHGVAGYPTVEHFFVAMKSQDPKVREHVKTIETPGKVKRYGRTIELRKDWHEIKLMVMRYALAEKFKAGTDLAARLLQTGSAQIVEGNRWHDNYWGDCSCKLCSNIRGSNHLGRMLMAVRRILQEEG